MRTTATFDPDVAAALKRIMKERDITFKEALNSTLRSGLDRSVESPAFRVKAKSLGVPTIDLTKALAISDQLEDDEMARRRDSG